MRSLGRIAAALGLSVAAILTVVSCGIKWGDESQKKSAPHMDRENLPTQVLESLPVTADEYCGNRIAQVKCFSSEGGALSAIAWSGAEAIDSSAVLWDPGGPGLGVPPAISQWVEAIPPALADRNVVMVVEPWISMGIASSCLEVETAPRCDPAPLRSTPSRTLRLLDEVTEDRNWHLQGVFATSFGAPRTLPIMARRTVEWAVFQTPAPPSQTSITDIVRARSDLIRDSMSRYCRDPICEKRERIEFEKLMRDGMDGIATGRQVALGLIAVLTEAAENRGYLEKLVSSVSRGNPSERLVRQLKIAGRSFFPESRHQHSPSSVAMWVDICPTYANWNGLSRLDPDPIVGALADIYQGCNQEYFRQKLDESNSVLEGTRVLLIEGDQDFVVPLSLQRSWREVLQNVDSLDGDGHGRQSKTVDSQIMDWMRSE